VTITTLSSEARAAAAGDASWVGSTDHLTLLTDSLEPIFGLSDVVLSWGPSGEPGYWEADTREIVLERPTPIAGQDPKDLAEATVLSLLHETLHIRLSTPAPSFRQNLTLVNLGLRPTTEVIFNLLEDGRIAMLATADSPEFGPPLERFATLAVDQLEMRTGPNASTREPSRPTDQLAFAVMAYALLPDRVIVLHPTVSKELGGLKEAIDQTRAGTTEDCGATAITLVERISEFRP
jgi:hypothetical protein